VRKELRDSHAVVRVILRLGALEEDKERALAETLFLPRFGEEEEEEEDKKSERHRDQHRHRGTRAGFLPRKRVPDGGDIRRSGQRHLRRASIELWRQGNAVRRVDAVFNPGEDSIREIQGADGRVETVEAVDTAEERAGAATRRDVCV